MGAVHAKQPEIITPMSDDTGASLDKIPARVDVVSIDGVCKTKNDILVKCVQDLFDARTFSDVVSKTRLCREYLESLGAFKQIGVFIDTSRGSEATPSGLHVLFFVKEVRNVVGGINTLVGHNEGSLVIGAKLPNTFGRGEFVQTEYHHGTKNSYGFNLTASKPFINRFKPRVTSAIYQSAADFPTNAFRETDRGILLEAACSLVPDIHHSLRWEGVWRELGALGVSVPFPVREQLGHTLKSSLKHIATLDTRDATVLARSGCYAKLTQEVAGLLGGDIEFLKHDIDLQLNIPLNFNLILQGCFSAGYLQPLKTNKKFNIADNFFLGGPLSVRGFLLRGLGPHSDAAALGGTAFWAGGAHLYAPLPFQAKGSRIDEFLRTHFFVTAGALETIEANNWRVLLDRLRFSAGFGLVLSIGHVARFELNYCVPLKYFPGDRINPGLQFGIGMSFL